MTINDLAKSLSTTTITKDSVKQVHIDSEIIIIIITASTTTTKSLDRINDAKATIIVLSKHLL